MPDYATINTPRFRMRYRVLSQTHNITWRLEQTKTIADAGGVASKMAAFLAAIQSHLYNDFTVLSAAWAEVNSELFLPCATPASPTGGVSTSGITRVAGTISMGFVGRGAGGSKAGFYLYGHNYDVPINSAAEADFRLTAAEVGVVADAIEALTELSPALYAIDRTPVTWYNYVNLKYNDRWVRKARNG